MYIDLNLVYLQYGIHCYSSEKCICSHWAILLLTLQARGVFIYTLTLACKVVLLFEELIKESFNIDDNNYSL